MASRFLERLAQGPLLFDGGNGTEIYGRGVFINVNYDALNLERPEIVEDVHRAYVNAGADAVETNTFAANRPRLESHGLAERVREINRAGAELARRAVGDSILVAGAVGPLGIRLEPWGPTTVDEAVALFLEQVEGQVEGGVDLFVLETFADLVEIQAAIKAVRKACDLPVVAMMTVDEEGRTPEGVPPEWLGQKLEETGADVVGVNCSVGPASMLTVVETMAQVCKAPLAAMPNAGTPRTIDGRMHYLTSPVYMARYVRRFIEAGVRVVGGCCGVTPDHVRAMREVLGHTELGRQAAPRVQVAVPRIVPRRPVPRAQKSRLARKVCEGRFVTMVELTPPRGCEAEALVSEVGALAAAGLDAVLVPDDPRALTRMSSLAAAWLLLDGSGARSPAWDAVEPILQYSCRDRTLLGMQSDLLGAHALGLRNLMPITGNAPRPGEASWSTNVFDVDAIGLTNVVARLNHGLDVGDTPIGDPTRFYTVANATIGAPDLEAEVRRFEWKVDAGAELGVTTPVFSRAGLLRFLDRVESVRIPIVATLYPVVSLREAEKLSGEVPGVNVPDELLASLSEAESPEAERAAGLEFSRRLIGELRPLVEGVCLAGPLATDAEVLALLEGVTGSHVLGERSYPGHPGIKGGSEGLRYQDDESASP